MSFCKNCGRKIEEGETKCSGCGKEIIINNPNTIKASGRGDQNPISFKFCTQCGNKIYENEDKCSICGKLKSPRTATAIGDTVETTVTWGVLNTTPNGQIVTKKRIDKKTTILIIILSIVVLFCIAGYAVGKKYTSSQQVISSFKQAVTTKNNKKLASIIISSDAKLKIDEENVKALSNYLGTNTSYFKEVTDSLYKQNLDIEKFKALKINNSKVQGNYTFELKNVGKKLLFFDNYAIQVNPCYVNISTNYKDVDLFVNDTKVVTTDIDNFSKEFGPYVPGAYKIKAIYNGKYAKLENEGKVDLVDSNYTNSVNVGLDGYFVNVECDFNDADIYVNNSNTGLKAKDAYDFGPVDSSTKFYAQREFPWGTMKSEEVNASSGYVSLKVSSGNEEFKKVIEGTIDEYLKSRVLALTSKDASKYVNVADGFRQQLKYDIDDMLYWDKLYVGKAIKNVFDINSLYIYEKDNTYKTSINVRNFAEDTFYYEGLSAQTSQNQYTYTYYLTFDSTTNKWLIEDTEYCYYFNEEKVDESTLN